MKNTNNFIKDPIHGTMEFSALEDNWIKPFINSPAMQRLRHIKQLGMGDFIFPGAVHTRFNHSLGCCYLSRQIALNLGLSDQERQVVMLACLLHDIGHGPFSHVLEDLFAHKLIKHEDWTTLFLADYNQINFINQYNQRNSSYELTNGTFEQINALIKHQGNCPSLMADIVSSQLDADRLDYLLRDSHFCGVNYGNFDLHWLLNALTIITIPTKNKVKRLGINYKGIGVAEHYLMARRLMMRNIYFLHKKLALEYLLIQFLLLLAQQLATDPIQQLCHSGLGKFLLEVNQFNNDIKNVQDVSARKKQFLHDTYPVYKELCDYDILAVIRSLAIQSSPSQAGEVAQRIHNRMVPKIINIEVSDLKLINELIEEYKEHHADTIKHWQLALISTPQQSYLIDSGPILVLNSQGVQPLDQASFIINAIADKNEPTAFICIDRAILEHKAIKKLLSHINCKL